MAGQSANGLHVSLALHEPGCWLKVAQNSVCSGLCQSCDCWVGPAQGCVLLGPTDMCEWHVWRVLPRSPPSQTLCGLHPAAAGTAWRPAASTQPITWHQIIPFGRGAWGSPRVMVPTFWRPLHSCRLHASWSPLPVHAAPSPVTLNGFWPDLGLPQAPRPLPGAAPVPPPG